ncbi:hypothetical protein BWQ96_09829 [Gracilariopsis chorda]|uniref:Chromo domain-containing protein n=1 Tax=Gracilariopsis chorda TaxID=448386 RepID=A0A2V3IEG3_9FLOR|nr:hypothetical protein BWQ96_09829 [Gracilariopsis chorda]|eukprot:PXF40453.1 hypothetical protein BWQ96_09829 [Gracilariopsis chorda]
MTPAQAKQYTRKRKDDIIRTASTRLAKSQRRYKNNFDKAVRFTPSFKAGDTVYLDRAPSGKPQDDIEVITRKLLPRSTGPYQVLSSTSHTVTIEIDGLQDTVAIDRITAAPEPPKPTGSPLDNPEDEPPDAPNSALQDSTHTNEQPSSRSKKLMADPLVNPTATSPPKVISADPLPPSPQDESNDGVPSQSANDDYAPLDEMDLPEEWPVDVPKDAASLPKESAIDRVVNAGIDDDGVVKYRVRWYGYKPSEDTWEPRENIPEKFVLRFWRRMGHTERDLKEGAYVLKSNCQGSR